MNSFTDFTVFGRIQYIKKTLIRSNKEPMLQVRLALKGKKNVTALVFGGLVDEVISDADSLPITYGSDKNPWALVQGSISENAYERDSQKISETTLTAKKVVLFYPAANSKNSVENFDNMIKEINLKSVNGDTKSATKY